MPLPFLTADRAFEAADDIALPFDDRDRWRRPYRPGPWRVGAAALWLLLASFVLFAAVIIAFTAPAPEAAVVFGIALAVIAVALRLLRVGAWVSARGLRQVSFFGTRTTPWDRIVAVRTVQQPVRWLGLPRTVQGQALVLVRNDRAAQDAPVLLTTHSADFLARAGSFDRAADAIEAWAAEHRRD
ncbi:MULTISPECIES: PH domain-containing protein [unclassified Streptomyces]|uniref:PH domain-containing protein n=1 Tax=unclassified Streptomyces TaxID=2593676 RepID=UPI002258AACA|nr:MULTISPECIES: PH domain-containing protein [unclassified Streptomyces]MCX5051448.1 PH domain-containing protein [Streptomyces sp. NBC_00474]MCX5061786.1 PH domain-containing protein [Streptomyces sp. NBC_00452]MCX5249340.1 PH domain-containing protein [Streptomyces sp. NBC_00201]MCX5292603.1 PH domain-containing protein [Streptomyces sp. NBC_00183]